MRIERREFSWFHVLAVFTVFAWMLFRYVSAYPGEFIRAASSALLGAAAVLFIYLSGRGLFEFARLISAPQGNWWLFERVIAIIPALVRGLFPPMIATYPSLVDALFVISALLLLVDPRSSLSGPIAHLLRNHVEQISRDSGANSASSPSTRFWMAFVVYTVAVLMVLADVAERV